MTALLNCQIQNKYTSCQKTRTIAIEQCGWPLRSPPAFKFKSQATIHNYNKKNQS